MPNGLPYRISPAAQSYGALAAVEQIRRRRRQQELEDYASLLGLKRQEGVLRGEEATRTFEALTRPYEFRKQRAETREAELGAPIRLRGLGAETREKEVGLREKEWGLPSRLGLTRTPVESADARASNFADALKNRNPDLVRRDLYRSEMEYQRARERIAKSSALDADEMNTLSRFSEGGWPAPGDPGLAKLAQKHPELVRDLAKAGFERGKIERRGALGMEEARFTERGKTGRAGMRLYGQLSGQAASTGRADARNRLLYQMNLINNRTRSLLGMRGAITGDVGQRSMRELVGLIGAMRTTVNELPPEVASQVAPALGEMWQRVIYPGGQLYERHMQVGDRAGARTAAEGTIRAIQQWVDTLGRALGQSAPLGGLPPSSSRVVPSIATEAMPIPGTPHQVAPMPVSPMTVGPSPTPSYPLLGGLLGRPGGPLGLRPSRPMPTGPLVAGLARGKRVPGGTITTVSAAPRALASEAREQGKGAALVALREGKTGQQASQIGNAKLREILKNGGFDYKGPAVFLGAYEAFMKEQRKSGMSNQDKLRDELNLSKKGKPPTPAPQSQRAATQAKQRIGRNEWERATQAKQRIMTPPRRPAPRPSLKQREAQGLRRELPPSIIRYLKPSARPPEQA